MAYSRLIWQGTVAAVILAMLLGTLYLFLQPSSWSAALGFRPVFEGAEQGFYPNQTRFAVTDITATTVIDEVYEANAVAQYCQVDDFRAGFVIEESSPDLQFLRLEFLARLSDTRLTVIDRQRLQEEFAARRTSLSRRFELRFIRNADCATLPDQVITKSMSDVLNTWARQAQERRGVLKARVPVLGESVFNTSKNQDPSLLVQADLVRSAIDRVILSIAALQSEPGSDLIRVGEERLGLLEVRLRLEDLRQTRLDPLISNAGRGLGRASIQYVQQALDGATIRLTEAEKHAETYRQALREYVGTTPVQAASTSGAQAPRSGDVQMLAPQIDRTFIDGILDLSSENTAFRQELTRNSITYALEAATRAAAVEHYRRLLESMAAPADSSLSPEVVRKALADIVVEAREATRQFNLLYEEYSKVTFRPGPYLFRLTEPATVTMLRSFDVRDLGALVLGTLVAAPILLGALCLALFYARSYIASAALSRPVKNTAAQ